MKISIVTRVFNENNQGQRLQAYALSTYLAKMFNAEVQVYDPRNPKQLNFFRRFECNCMHMKPVSSAADFNDGTDFYVIGSDITLSLDLLNHWFFSVRGIPADKKLTYAASDFGQLAPFNDKIKQFISANLNVKCVSVRERSMQSYLQQHMNMLKKNVVVHQNIDPVFLLSRADWEAIERKPDSVNADEKFNFTYHIANAKNERRVNSDGTAEYVLYGNNYNSDAFQPDEFLWMIHHCQVFQTNSFHGLAFGLLFNKKMKLDNFDGKNKFNAKAGNQRMQSILDVLGVSFDESGNVENYSLVLGNVSAEQKSAYEYFKNAFTPTSASALKNCSGCMACADACPTDAISSVMLSGFRYPLTDSKLCTSCRACDSACPIVKPRPASTAYSCYLASCKDARLRTGSSSGGFVKMLSRRAVSENGVVYGVAWAYDFKSCHFTRASIIDDVEFQSKSKYLESGPIPFDMLHQDISQKKKILFVGTPCQIAAVKSRFRTAPGLTTVSLICNSVPSQSAWQQYLESLERAHNSNVVHVNMRSQINDMLIVFENGDVVHQSVSTNDWYKHFLLDANAVRPSCRACKFKWPNIPGDFLVGDAWGFNLKSSGFPEKSQLVFCLNESADKTLLRLSDEMQLQKLPANSVLEITKTANKHLWTSR